jgi:hypothetical protein
MENVGTFYAPLEYVIDNVYILWYLSNCVVIWYIFPRFGKLSQEKSGNPGRACSCLFSLRVSFLSSAPVNEIGDSLRPLRRN